MGKGLGAESGRVGDGVAAQAHLIHVVKHLESVGTGVGEVWARDWALMAAE